MKGVCKLIALYILAVLLLLIALVLLLPVSVDIGYKEDFFVKVKFAKIKVFPISEKEQKQKKDKPKPHTKKENQFKTSFQKLKEKYGFSGAVNEIFAFLYNCLKHFGSFLKTVKFRKVKLNLVISESDAFKTAIKYGEVCGFVYPVLSYLESKANIKYKQIDIKSDFNAPKGEFDFSLTVNLQIIFLIITAFKVYKEYKKFSVRNGL